ncbi:MAG: DUF4431 domain-containing protein [Burkholderiaceae bacterium]|nr:DUF4431 domain-containing protein [Burkholderiaceae bacterium]
MLLATLFTDAISAREHCFNYEPAKVALSGKLLRKTYPGTPNFESVAKGDHEETGYYLQLAAGICVRAKQEDEAGDHMGVKVIQLVLSEKQYELLRPALGTRITLIGSLFEAHTGHHHTPVLLIVHEVHP